MQAYATFFLEFMEPFFKGISMIFNGLIQGIWKMLNILNYIEVINNYKGSLSGIGIVVLIINIICLLGLFGLLIFIIVKIIRKAIKYYKNMHKEEDLADEIDRLNSQVYKLKATNEKLLAMANNEEEVEYDEDGNIINKLKDGESRFYKLTAIDEAMQNYQQTPGNNTINLKDFCTAFKNFSASRLKLYYTDKMIRLFVAAFASNRLIILEGISGTGKTSLAYAMGQMLKNDSIIASVQPSWRDNSELFGYFNEFTKKFNESDVLSAMYEAKYKDDVYITILDEMNIARVEYYFAEMLSVLELPSKNDWVIELVPNAWDNDPKLLVQGKIRIPDNMWYVGTINNDDSTFMVTDKVYDRAMPIAINDKCEVFSAPDTEPIKLTSDYFQKLLNDANLEHPITQEYLDKINLLDRYIINHFRLAFGNRIVKQLTQFVPAFVACGGDMLEGIDYVIAHKILRKFDQLNFSLIKNEVDGLISYFNELFGENTMTECLAYLDNFKKQYR